MTPLSSSWRNAYIALGLALAALIVMYWATVASTVALWSKDPLAHGYLVIPATVYLAWERRGRLSSLRPRPAFWALPLLGLLALLWLAGNLTGTAVIQQISLLAMLVGFVWGVLGSPVARILSFPLALLLFALPLGDQLVPALQDVTARFAVKMLDLSGVPVLLEGHVISIPGGSWRVAEACSGINYLTSSLAIGYLYAGMAYRYWVHRVGFLLASALLPLVANALRVYTTILIASLGGTRIVASMGHYLYGWFIFAIIMGLLLVTCGRWSEKSVEGSVTPLEAEPAVAAVPRWSPVLVAVLGVLLVGIAPLSARSFWLPLEANQTTLQARAPEVSLPWRVVERDRYGWTPRFATPSREFIQTYDSGNAQVRFYVASYDANQPGVKLATTTNVLFEDPWWAAGTGGRTVTQEGQSFQVRETRLVARSSSLIVWTWYWVDGRFTSNDYVAKLLLAKARLFRTRQGSAAIAVAIEYRPDVEATAILQDFLDHFSLTGSLGVTTNTE